MWKLSKIEIENIVSIREATLRFEQGVATLIFGKNEDNASQPCNGSGKSSLIEAIALAFTGEQLRKVKSIDEIINDSEETASVCLTLINDFDSSEFIIERVISRFNPQEVKCHKFDKDGNPIDQERMIQPSVADYNKFILNEIGLTKDEIYHNFILCDNKYESFFDCSDRSKKEIINRFSNGQLVDESIARVQADMVPVQQDLDEWQKQINTIKGSVAAIETELSKVGEKKISAAQKREEKLHQIESQIVSCRNNIEITSAKKIKGQDRLKELKEVQVSVQELEDSSLGVTEAYQKIVELCAEHDLGSVSNYDNLVSEYNKSLQGQKTELDSCSTLILSEEANVAREKKIYANEKLKYDALVQNNDSLSKGDQKILVKIKEELTSIDYQMDKIESDIRDNKQKQSDLESKIFKYNAILNGAVECPNCQHKFFVGKSESYQEVEEELARFKQELQTREKTAISLSQQFDTLDAQGVAKEDEYKNVENKIKARSKELEENYKSLKQISLSVDRLEDKISSLQRHKNSIENEVDRLAGKIDIARNRLFGEINGLVEGRILNGENFIHQQNSTLDYYQGQLSQFQKSKKELIEQPEIDFETSLKTSLNQYLVNLGCAEKNYAKVQHQLNKLKDQEANFVMFKSYIARKKIDALSAVVNDFLERIGSDIRLRLDGYSVTKTGKLRDKISIQVMRDGIDCGSYYKFSGGEKARLNLACILALHALTNSNCEAGKGLDFIVIDELLDKSDEMGMATYCEALNKLHQTALLITQGAVAESYPHKLLIVKKQGVSSILQ